MKGLILFSIISVAYAYVGWMARPYWTPRDYGDKSTEWCEAYSWNFIFHISAKIAGPNYFIPVECIRAFSRTAFPNAFTITAVFGESNCTRAASVEQSDLKEHCRLMDSNTRSVWKIVATEGVAMKEKRIIELRKLRDMRAEEVSATTPRTFGAVTFKAILTDKELDELNDQGEKEFDINL